MPGTGHMAMGCCKKQRPRLLLLWLCFCILATVTQPAIIPPLSDDLGTTDTCGIAVCFAIDASGSIGSTNFQKAKQFVVNVIDGVSKIATVAQYGASLFQTDATPVAGLSSMISDATAAKTAINNIKYPDGGYTNMEGGIAECFRVEGGVKSGVLTRNILPNLPRILLMLTDGKPNAKYTASPPTCPCNQNSKYPLTCIPRDYNGNTDTSLCSMQATQNRAAAVSGDGIKFISIGVGSGVDATFLTTLGDYYSVADFNDLSAAVARILRGLCSDVAVAKSTSASPQPIGGGFSFRIDLVNTGKFDIPAGGLNFTDTLPLGLSYDSASGVMPLGSSPPAACSFNTAARQVFCTTNTVLPVGGTWSYALSATATVAGTWTNTANVIANPDNNPINSQDTANVVVSPDPPKPPPPITDKDLQVTKTVDPPTVVLGTTVTYTLTVKNIAPETTAESLFALDTLPAGLQVVTTALPAGCTAAGQEVACGPVNLEPGASVQYQVLVSPRYDGVFDNSAIAKAGTGNNTVQTKPVVATVTVQHTCSKYELDGSTLVPFNCGKGEFNGTAANNINPSQEVCCIPLNPKVAMSKAVTPTGTVVEGSVSYRVSVSNTGDGVAEALILVDQVSKGLVFVEPLPDETAKDCYFPQRVDCRDPVKGRPCAQPTYDTLVCGPLDLDPGTTRVYTVPAVAVLPGVWNNTASATYLVPATNATERVGPVSAEVTVARTCAHFNDDSSPFQCRSGTELNPMQANSTNTTQDNCCETARMPQLTIQKTAADSSVLIGNKTTFLIVVSNIGNKVASSLVVTDALPDGFSFSTPIPSGCSPFGATLTCRLASLAVGATQRYRVPVTAVQAGSWTNTASATADGNVTTNSNGAAVVVTRTCENYYSDGSKFKCSPGSKYNSAKADDPDPGQQTCCIDCKTCADFVDLCGTFDDGCGATINCTCPADKPYCHQPSGLLRASLAGFCNDDPFDPTDNLDVSITKTGPADPVLVNTEFEFELRVRVEEGENGARNVTVTDTLPNGLDLVSVTPDTCRVTGVTILCRLGTMQLAESRFVTIRVKSSVKARYTNTASVSAVGDKNLSNNNDTAVVKVECKTCSNSYPGLCGPFDDGCNGTITCECPSNKPFCHQDNLLRGIGAPGYCSDKPIEPTDVVVVSITKTGPLSPVTVGEEFDFTLAIRVEQGLQGANGVVVTDTLPKGLELVAVDPDSSCTIKYPSIVCNLGYMYFTETRLITIRVKANTPGMYTNRARVTAINDTSTGDNTSSATVTVKDNPKVLAVAISKTVSTPIVLIGSTVLYTLTASNVGTADANSVLVQDTLPQGMSYLSPLPADCTASGNLLTCGPTSLAVGTSQSYKVSTQAVVAGAWNNSAVVSARNDGSPYVNGPVVAPVLVQRTCKVYNSDGSRYSCSPGSKYNLAQNDNLKPDQQSCCIDCATCFDFPGLCGVFDDGCGTSITCTCPADKPFCIQGTQLTLAAVAGYCSDQPIEPTKALNVSITKDGPDTPQIVGAIFDFVLQVRVVQGDKGANSVIVTDTLPASLDLVSTSADTGAAGPQPCDVSGSTIRCDVGPMALSETRFITVTVKGNSAGSVTNVAKVAAKGDNNDSNDSSQKTVQVICKTCANSYPGLCGPVSDGCGGIITCTCPLTQPFCHHGPLLKATGEPGYCSDQPIDPTSTVEVSITKTGPKGAQVVGQEYDYVLLARVEDGLDGAQNVVVTDVLPSRLELVAVNPGDLCTVNYPLIKCFLGNMLYTETKVITVTVKANKPGRFANTANVTADNQAAGARNNDTAAAVVVAGSCCSPDGSCSQIAKAQCTGEYQLGVTCEFANCGRLPTIGACCLPNGRCRNRVQAVTCSDKGGIFYPDRTCTPQLCAAPSPSPSPSPAPSPRPSPPPSPSPAPLAVGACCIASSRKCQPAVTQASCLQQKGTWKKDALCSAGYCPAAAGACCLKARCLDVLGDQCKAEGGAFNLGKPCSSGICGGSCIPSWLPCVPCTQPSCSDSCCPGNSCKAVYVQGGQRFYTCKPDDVCRREGEPCGDCQRGAVCCAGLICKWNYKAHAGICSKPSPCSYVGQACKLDTDCCPGARCGIDGKCRGCTCSKKCGKGKGTCSSQQLMDCGAVSAAAASGAYLR